MYTLKEKILGQKNDSLQYYAPLAFLLAGLMPEYVAPFFTVAGFAAVVKNRIKTKSKPRFGDVGISILIYIAWMVISSFWSSSAISSLASIGLWLLMFSGYYFFTETVDTEDKIDKIMLCGCLSAGVAGAIGVGQIFLYHYGDFIYDGIGNFFNPFWRFLNILVEKIVAILPDFITSNFASKTFHSFDTRACSTYSNPLFFATIELLLMPFAGYIFLCSESKKRSFIGFICMIMSIGGIACSYSRGPYLFTVIVFLILFLYGGKKTLKLISVGAISGGIVLAFASGTLKRLLTLLSGKDISINTRKLIWDAVFEMIKEKPIWGYGTGFDNIRQMLHNVYNIKQPHAHNIILEAWVENGIFGAILLAFIFVVFVVNIVRLIVKGGKGREFAVTLFASLTGFLLCGMTDCVFYGLKPLQYMMMVLGLSQAVFTLYLNTKNNGEKQ